MKINCLSCGFKVDLDDMYSDYAGQIKCYACGALMQIETRGEKLVSVSRAERTELTLSRSRADEPPPGEASAGRTKGGEI